MIHLLSILLFSLLLLGLLCLLEALVRAELDAISSALFGEWPEARKGSQVVAAVTAVSPRLRAIS